MFRVLFVLANTRTTNLVELEIKKLDQLVLIGHEFYGIGIKSFNMEWQEWFDRRDNEE